MRKTKVIISIQEYRQRRKYFLKPESADFYVLIQSKVFSLHKKFIKDSQVLIKQAENEQRKIYLLDEQFQMLNFLKVIGCLYGLEFCFQRTWEIIPIYEMIKYLEIGNLKQMIQNDFRKNFQQYGFFLLFSIAIKFNIQWLRTLCIEQLICYGFQQINFNQFDLYQCQLKIVKEIIELYKSYQHFLRPKIISRKTIKKILSQYDKYNNLNSHLDYFNLLDLDNVILQTDSQEFQEQQMKISKKDNSCTSLKVKEEQKLVISTEKTASSSGKNSKQNNESTNQTKQNDGLHHSNQLENVPLLQRSYNIQDSEDFVKSTPQIKEEFEVDSNNISFSNLCQITEANFLQSTQLPRKQSCKKGKRMFRSISPPASPNTPQFGYYLTLKNAQEQKKNKEVQKNRKYKNGIQKSSKEILSKD